MTDPKIVYDDHIEEPVGPVVKGYDFNQGVNYSDIIKSFSTTGFQATHLSKAISIVNSMIKNNAKHFSGAVDNEKSCLDLPDVVEGIIKLSK